MKATVKISVRNNQQMDDLYTDIKSTIESYEKSLKEQNALVSEQSNYEYSALQEAGINDTEELFLQRISGYENLSKYYDEKSECYTEEGVKVLREIEYMVNTVLNEVRSKTRYREISERLKVLRNEEKNNRLFLNIVQGYLFDNNHKLVKYKAFNKAWKAVCNFWGPDFD